MSTAVGAIPETDRTPLVSIGIPVYNGNRFLIDGEGKLTGQSSFPAPFRGGGPFRPERYGTASDAGMWFRRRYPDYLDEDGFLEQEPLRKLASDRQLAVYDHKGFWHSMDTYKDVESLQQKWDRGVRPWVVWK